MSDVASSAPAAPPHAVSPEPSGERLHRPARLVVALAELAVAAVAVWGAFACWDAAVGTMTVRLDDGTELVSRIYEGNWVGLAFTLVAVAGLLVVDAVRQTMLGVRTKRRRGGRTRRGRRSAEHH